MGLFDKTKEPVFLKETSSAKLQLQELEKMLLTASATVKPKIEQDIKTLSYGIFGENQIIFELKNSHLPIYVLHDLFLEYNGLHAQIDFLIISEKQNFVVECKNLIGNIEINQNGDFLRTTNYNGTYNKEGIYSPITQNRRHLDLIKQIRSATRTNFITKSYFEKYFYNNYQGIVVLANPKTVLDAKSAPQEVQDQVIRVDRLVDYIRQANVASRDASASNSQMEELAQFFLDAHQENPLDYVAKYRPSTPVTPLSAQQAAARVAPALRDVAPPKNAPAPRSATPPNTFPPRNATPQKSSPPHSATPQKASPSSPLYDAIRAWRAQKAKQEDLKAYHIFYNTTLDELVEKKPKTLHELRQITGLGDVKCQKYGEDLLRLIAQHR